MQPRTDLQVANLTDVGRERDENQDYYGFFEPAEDAEFAHRGRIAVICDGMGGHAGGEVASRVAVETIVARYSGSQGADPGVALRDAVEAANAAIRERARAEPALDGMGSTCVALVARGGLAWVAHVGDSRCYRIRGGALEQIGRDHSLVQRFIEEGWLAEVEAENHPQKNVILRSLGVAPEVVVDVALEAIEPGDAFLLSTDGLTGVVSKEECLRIVLSHADPVAAVRALVALANERGGPDNVTVQLLRFPAPALASRPIVAPAIEADPAPTRARSSEPARPPDHRPGLLRRLFSRLFARETMPSATL